MSKITKPMSEGASCSVLFVCLGNICRSPAAEGVFRKFIADADLAKHVVVDSAGTGDWHLGELADVRMRQVAAKRGYELLHRARQIKVADFAAFDFILTMDESNFRNVSELAPSKTDLVRVQRFTQFNTKLDYPEVPDPYHGSLDDFSLVIDILEDGCRGLLKNVSERLGGLGSGIL
ncbi:MAG: low molecular weight phosphotyrosine protein phosphatase [Proteobacteria bacterium]|nr:low molecular weight phosphotyrosine protein phosphatase [Pseudomonadota bacterium]